MIVKTGSAIYGMSKQRNAINVHMASPLHFLKEIRTNKMLCDDPLKS